MPARQACLVQPIRQRHVLERDRADGRVFGRLLEAVAAGHTPPELDASRYRRDVDVDLGAELDGAAVHGGAPY